MQSTSQTWKSLFASGDAMLEARATIDGVVYADIAPVIARAMMGDALSVGNVVSATCALTLRDAQTVPKGAEVPVEMRLTDGNSTSEWIPAGTFYISKRTRDPVTGALTLECYDALLKANAAWAPSAGSWPRTMAAVVEELRALLGVALDSRTVIHTGAAWVVNEPEAGATVRDALGFIAAAHGGSWVISPAGQLRLIPLTDPDDETADACAVTAVLGGIDVGEATGISGVRTVVEGVTALSGDETGAVVDASAAPAFAAQLAGDLDGQAWQAFTLTGAIYDPAAELGDVVRAGNGSAHGVLCSERATLRPAFRGDLSAPAQAEAGDEYPYIGAAQRTLTVAKAYAQEVTDALSDSLTQQDIFNRLTNNGAVQGMILVDGQLYINASYINAGSLSASRISGGTLTLGGSGNTNGTIDVKDAQGNTIGWWNRQGLGVIAGGGLTIGSYSDGSRIRTLSVVPTWDENRRVARLLFEGYADNDDEYVVDVSPGFLSVSRQEYDPEDDSYSDKYEMKFDACTGRLILSADGRSRLYLDLANLRFQWSGDVVINGNYGVSGTFTTKDNKNVTVTNGIITRMY